MERRVVISGLGTVNPMGHNVGDFWKGIKNMENGITRVSHFDPSDHSSQVVGEVKDFSAKDYMDGREARRMDPFAIFAVVASGEALRDAGIKDGDVNPEKLGVVLGNGTGGLETMGNGFIKLFEKGTRSMHPLLGTMMITNIAAGNVAIKYNAQGPNYTVVTACASATDAIGQSYRLIKYGMCDTVITGGTEASITPLGLGAFCNLQAVGSRFNDAPEKASRPFDKDRDGFIMSEGAGILILEELEQARKRGAKIYAEICGYGESCDANHLTAPHPEGRGAVSAMRKAIEHAGLKPEDIDYINAHGTSTPVNDPVETKAIKAVFGEHVKKLKISSTKSMHGHLLGAAGGVEAIIVSLSLHEQYYPGTRNLDNPDPECDLNYLANKGVEGPMSVAISNSFGFGGQNAVIVFKRYQ